MATRSFPIERIESMLLAVRNKIEGGGTLAKIWLLFGVLLDKLREARGREHTIATGVPCQHIIGCRTILGDES